MKERIRQHARELGFDDCRFSTANPPESAEHFKRWLAERQHGEMNYLDRNAYKRVDPQQVLSGAKSIISLAVSYAHQEKGQLQVDDTAIVNNRCSGRIAAYA